jgi:hypothetical protein
VGQQGECIFLPGFFIGCYIFTRGRGYLLERTKLTGHIVTPLKIDQLLLSNGFE